MHTNYCQIVFAHKKVDTPVFYDMCPLLKAQVMASLCDNIDASAAQVGLVFILPDAGVKIPTTLAFSVRAFVGGDFERTAFCDADLADDAQRRECFDVYAVDCGQKFVVIRLNHY